MTFETFCNKSLEPIKTFCHLKLTPQEGKSPIYKTKIETESSFHFFQILSKNWSEFGNEFKKKLELKMFAGNGTEMHPTVSEMCVI